jgi:hypothetical protein
MSLMRARDYFATLKLGASAAEHGRQSPKKVRCWTEEQVADGWR